MLYEWMETHVSQPDGSWLNEPVEGSWKGTTVFAAIALAEAWKNHGTVLDGAFTKRVTERLFKAGEYIYTNFTVQYGNINYPVTGAYGLSLLGTLLGEPKFTQKGKQLAHDCMSYFTTESKLLFGEGDLSAQKSKKGCYAIDLGYNVEESLPSLVMYALHTGDKEILEIVTRSLQSHMQFMLPDGSWDNSWGTRNYKWTYWGSRTSDGCQTAYALMAHRDNSFYSVALKNTQLLKACTTNGLLQGGPHCAAQGITPCVHHTFSHCKSLTTILDYGNRHEKLSSGKIAVPREQLTGSRFFPDIQTWLISKGMYRATVTAYDKEYKNTKNGHATGGALTMLWHEKAGPLFSASMNQYQLFEAGNMQPDPDPLSMPLTPRIQLRSGNKVYMNISDLHASVKVKTDAGGILVHTTSQLVDKDQQHPAAGEIHCHTSYYFTAGRVVIQYAFDHEDTDGAIQFIFPLISLASEKITVVSDRTLLVQKEKCRVKVSSNHAIVQLPATNGRVFNFVPGFQAIPICIVDKISGRVELETG